MKKIGITGSIGSGKSAVSKFLAERGFKVIDADQIIRELYYEKDFIEEMIGAFGEEVLSDNKEKKELDRKKIAKIVFSDKAMLDKLDSLVSPFYKSRMQKDLDNSKEDVVFLDIPLLYEKGYKDFMDEVIVVYCDDKIRFDRASKRDGKSVGEIKKVDETQLSQEQKKELADYVLDNSRSIEDLYSQIEKLLKSKGLNYGRG